MYSVNNKEFTGMIEQEIKRINNNEQSSEKGTFKFPNMIDGMYINKMNKVCNYFMVIFSEYGRTEYTTNNTELIEKEMQKAYANNRKFKLFGLNKKLIAYS